MNNKVNASTQTFLKLEDLNKFLNFTKHNSSLYSCFNGQLRLGKIDNCDSFSLKTVQEELSDSIILKNVSKKQNSLNDIYDVNDFSQVEFVLEQNKQNSLIHKSDNFLIELKNVLEKRNESKAIQGNI